MDGATKKCKPTFDCAKEGGETTEDGKLCIKNVELVLYQANVPTYSTCSVNGDDVLNKLCGSSWRYPTDSELVKYKLSFTKYPGRLKFISMYKHYHEVFHFYAAISGSGLYELVTPRNDSNRCESVLASATCIKPIE